MILFLYEFSSLWTGIDGWVYRYASCIFPDDIPKEKFLIKNIIILADKASSD